MTESYEIGLQSFVRSSLEAEPKLERSSEFDKETKVISGKQI